MSKLPSKDGTPNKPKSGIFGMLDSISRAQSDDGTTRVALDDIAPDPNQPRRVFDDEKLDNLAESIKDSGILQPLLVRRSGSIPPYFIISGERRWRAAKMAGLKEVPVFVRDDLASNDEQRMYAQLIENQNREGLSDYEVAKAIQGMIDKSENPKQFGLKASIAKLLNVRKQDISRLLAMLTPENSVLVESGVVTSADALSRLRALPEDAQAKLIEQARETGEPVTRSDINAVKRAAEQPKPAEAAATSSVPTANVSDEDNNTPAASGETADEAAADGTPIPVANPADKGESPASPGAFVDATGEGDRNEDPEAGTPFGDAAANEGRATASNGGNNTPRAKAVSVSATGEAVEILLGCLVDKSSDRLEVRLPADLAIAVIENLHGEVPEDPADYGQRIRDLLADKLRR